MQDDEITIDGPAILIPPGQYDAKVVAIKRIKKFSRPMLWMRFEIVSMDKYSGALLEAWLPLGGGGRVSGKSKLGRWYLVLRAPGRKDRISLKAFRARLLRVSVRTVTKDYRQQPLTPGARYSVVDDLVGVSAMLSNNPKEFSEDDNG